MGNKCLQNLAHNIKTQIDNNLYKEEFKNYILYQCFYSFEELFLINHKM